jgi:ABC-type branched-subunit amino acid transport system substrate-binding protein
MSSHTPVRPRTRPERRRRSTAVAATAVLLSSALAACGGDSGAASDGDTIKFGFLAEQSGSYEEFGRAAKAAADYAVEQINADGGLDVDGTKKKVELVVRNTRSEPAEGSALATELIAQDGVRYMFGATGLVAPAVFPVTDASEVLFFQASSAATAQIADTDFMYGTLPNTALRVRITMGAIKEDWPDAETVAFLGTDEPTANAVKASLEEAAAEVGLEVVAAESVPGGSTDFSGTLARIKSRQPDVLLHVADNTNSQATVIRQNEQIEAAPRIMAYAVGCDTAVNAGVENDYAANPLVGADLSKPSNDKAQALADHLEKALDGDMTYSYAAMWQYDYFGVLAAAIEEAGTADDIEAVQAALAETQYDGASGEISIADDRTAVFGFDICKVVDGQVEVEHVEPGAGS